MTTPKKSKGRNKGWDNLRPAKPGEVRNPKGRPPKVRCIPDILRRIGDEEGTVDGQHSKLDVVLRKVYQYALEGKPWAVQFIADRQEGTARQSIEMTQKRPPRIEIEIVQPTTGGAGQEQEQEALHARLDKRDAD